MALDDNPAGRLYSLLRTFVDMRPNNMLTSQAWAALLGVPGQPTLFERYALIVSLPDQIESQIRALGMRQYAGLISELPALKEQLADITTWNLPLPDTQARVSVSALTQLHAVSDVLSSNKLTSEPDVSEETLQGIRNDVESLLTDIGQATDVGNDLRLFLLDHLHAILRAVDSFRVGGSVELRRVIDETVGAQWVQAPSPSTDDEKAFSARFWEAVKRAAAIVALVSSSYTLVAQIDPQLGISRPADVAQLMPGPPLAVGPHSSQ
jgi:hypothetical protein